MSWIPNSRLRAPTGAPRWGPLALCALLAGCVPDVPVADEDAPDGGDLETGTEPAKNGPTAGMGGGKSGQSGGGPGTEPDADSAQGSDGNGGSASGTDGGPDAPPAMSVIEPEPIEEAMPYVCEADSDCEDALVCQAQQCVFLPPERVPSTTVQTVGGGLMTAPGQRLQLRIGAPPPVGRMAGGGNQLTLGPLAGH